MPIEPELAAKIRAMPKIELHRHLEGSVRLNTLVEIAKEHGIEMPEYTVEDLRPFVQMMPHEPRNMQHFLGKFDTLRQFYRSTEVIKRIAREAVIDAAHDQIRYMELRFTPKALSNITHLSFETIVALVTDEAKAAATECEIEVSLIVSVNRHESLEIAEKALDAAINYKDKGVVGFDLAGREAGFPAYPFRQIFKRAKKAGLFVTVHAGEWDGANSVWDAIGNLNADRIGHGIRAYEDPGIVRTLAEREITLEVCPSSNVDTGAVKTLETHPLPLLMRDDLRTTINTDDPLIFNISLSDEMIRAVNCLNLSLDDLKQSILCAAKSAFLPSSERDRLASRFHQWLAAV